MGSEVPMTDWLAQVVKLKEHLSQLSKDISSKIFTQSSESYLHIGVFFHHFIHE